MFIIILTFFLFIIVFKCPYAYAKPDTSRKNRLRWGVDDAGGPFALERFSWAGDMFKEFGFNLWVAHGRESKSVEENIRFFRAVDSFCKRNHLNFLWDLEHANWKAEHIDDKGRDWFNRDDGRHFQIYPHDLLEQLAKSETLLGIMYDEPSHMQNCMNMILNKNLPFAPWMYDPKGDELIDAAENFTRAVKEVADIHAKYGISLYTEHVFPILFHCFARAGYTPVPKILKESCSPVFIACAIGASLQYGKEFWVTPDLWGMQQYPGHSLDEYRSSLLLAYHMGADAIYTENLAYDQENKGVGSLILCDESGYQVTPYGEIAKWFIHEYVPSHPLSYSWQDIKPRVAIVRQPDACWGQHNSWLGDRLFGNEQWPSNDKTEAWLKVCHLLTNGILSTDGLTQHTGGEFDQMNNRLLYPLNGLVVFDHLVEPELLQDVEVIFLCGIGVSEKTLKGIQKRVEEGCICIAMPHLLPRSIRKVFECGENTVTVGSGTWVISDDMLSIEVQKSVENILPEENTIRYQFGNKEVIFRAIDSDPNRLEIVL